MPDIDEYSEHYGQYIREESPDVLLRYLRECDWHTLLDIGCGDGVLLTSLNREGLLNGKTVYAVDVSPLRIERVSKINPDFRCFVDDATRLQNFPDGSVDLVISTQVIEHVPDDRAMVLQVARVLRPGGTAYLTTVFKRRGAWYFYRSKAGWAIDPTHEREYTSDCQLTDKLREVGLGIACNNKYPIQKSIVGDRVLTLLGARRDIRLESGLMRFLTDLKVPVPGYYTWELVCRKE